MKIITVIADRIAPETLSTALPADGVVSVTFALYAAATDAAGQGLGIVYLTGRPERCRAETASWLARHGLPAGTLLMRPERDRRPAREYKVQALRELSREREVAWLLDDDGDVVTAAQAAGFPAVLADWTVREDVLRDAQEGSGRT